MVVINLDIERKVGRPTKNKEYVVRIQTTADPNRKRMVESSKYTFADVFEIGYNVLFGEEGERELLDIERKLAVLEPEVAMYKARKELLLANRRRKEEYNRQEEYKIKYLHAAFTQILKLQEKIGKITVREDWIRKIYGIQFDLDLVNQNFTQALEDIGLPPDYVVEKYNIKKLEKGDREDKMMVEIVNRNEREGQDGGQE